MGMPRLIVLQSKSNNKYLDYYKIKSDTDAPGLIKFTGESVLSSTVKLSVEKAKTGGGGLFHIRSCYNNKYLAKSQITRESKMITASADQPDEDQTKSTCTLFKVPSEDESEPNNVHVSKDPSDGTTARLRHVQSNDCVCAVDSFLILGISKPHKTEKVFDFTVIDWESLVILPKLVIFKSPASQMYLSAYSDDEKLYFQVVQPEDPYIPFEVVTNNDGTVQIKSVSKGEFWYCEDDDYIVLGPSDTSTAKHSFFRPIKVDDKTIALRTVIGDGSFCNGPLQWNCFSQSMDKTTLLTVEEPVVSRNVYNVDFRVQDARTYHERVITMATGDAVNKTDKPTTVEFKFTYTTTKTNTWNVGLSLQIGGKCSLEAGIPLIGKGKVEISGEFTGEYKWGDVVTATNVLETVYKVTVPKRTRVKVSLISTQASCNVPFSYVQEDLLTYGRRVTRTMDDGDYVGTNCYDFKYDTNFVKEKLTTE